MKWLIFGACGMAGHMVAAYLRTIGEDVTGFARKESPVCNTIIGDALEPSTWRGLLNSGNYDVVVNCIGVLNRAVDNNLPVGIYLNSCFPHELASVCSANGTKLIHISSDCVFSGKKGKYTENDIPDEISYYGRTKALGEVTYENHLTLRTSIIGPELKDDGVGLYHWFMVQPKVYGYTHVFWSGVTTLELAKAVHRAAKENLTGLYHLSNNITICKYDLLCLFNQYTRRQKIQILRQNTPVSDKTILDTRHDLHRKIPSYEEMIKDMAKWMRKHHELYVQYDFCK